MRLAIAAFLLALSLYSAALVAIELQTSQDYVRQYFTDIRGDVFLYAVNTTLSTFLLAGTALLLCFAAFAVPAGQFGRTSWFHLGQAAMFGLLAFDDRFLLHETLGYRLEVDDHYVLLVWAALQGALLGLGRASCVTIWTAVLFAAGCAFFALMLAFDALVPHDMVLRLSIEDLAKSWGAALFLGAAWFAARFHCGLDPDEATLADWLAGVRKRRVSQEFIGA